MYISPQLNTQAVASACGALANGLILDGRGVSDTHPTCHARLIGEPKVIGVITRKEP